MSMHHAIVMSDVYNVAAQAKILPDVFCLIQYAHALWRGLSDAQRADAIAHYLTQPGCGHSREDIAEAVLSPRANEIYAQVFNAMQSAEEIYGPEDYAELMTMIRADAAARVGTYRSNNA